MNGYNAIDQSDLGMRAKRGILLRVPGERATRWLAIKAYWIESLSFIFAALGAVVAAVSPAIPKVGMMIWVCAGIAALICLVVGLLMFVLIKWAQVTLNEANISYMMAD